MDEQQEDMWVQTGAQLAAARAMLRALKAIMTINANGNSEPDVMAQALGYIEDTALEAIKLAEATGLTTGEE